MDRQQKQAPRTVVAILRVLSAGIGLWTLTSLTQGLLSGSISYSVGEIDEIAVTTSGFWDTLLAYLMFSPFGAGLTIAGIAPELFVRQRWLFAGLLAISASAYIVAGLTESGAWLSLGCSGE